MRTPFILDCCDFAGSREKVHPDRDACFQQTIQYSLAVFLNDLETVRL